MPQFIKPGSPTLQVDSLLSAPPGKPYLLSIDTYLYLFILIPIQNHSVHFSVLAFPHLSFLISFSDSGKPGSPYYNVECVVNNYCSAILHIESSFRSASPYICEKKKNVYQLYTVLSGFTFTISTKNIILPDFLSVPFFPTMRHILYAPTSCISALWL